MAFPQHNPLNKKESDDLPFKGTEISYQTCVFVCNSWLDILTNKKLKQNT